MSRTQLDTKQGCINLGIPAIADDGSTPTINPSQGPQASAYPTQYPTTSPADGQNEINKYQMIYKDVEGNFTAGPVSEKKAQISVKVMMCCSFYLSLCVCVCVCVCVCGYPCTCQQSFCAWRYTCPSRPSCSRSCTTSCDQVSKSGLRSGGLGAGRCKTLCILCIPLVHLIGGILSIQYRVSMDRRTHNCELWLICMIVSIVRIRSRVLLMFVSTVIALVGVLNLFNGLLQLFVTSTLNFCASQ